MKQSFAEESLRTYEAINDKIASGSAVVLTADEIIEYVDRKGLEAAARDVDVVTTATFGAMCSSGCFFNFGHSKPKIRMTEAWLQDVRLYTGIAAVDAYIGASELRHNDPANMNYPGDFRYGGGHVIEDLVAGREVQLFALSYGTDDYPRREIRTYLTLDDFNQATMVNPRNCYQNYNIATNASDRTVYTYLGILHPRLGNVTYSSAGQLSPLLNDPLYETVGVGTRVWLAGSHGHVYAEGTQHCSAVERTDNDVPAEGAGTLALTAPLRGMVPKFVRGVSLKGYGASISLGIAVPIPILNVDVLRRTTIRDRDIHGAIIDYGGDYQQRSSRTLGTVTYEQLRSGTIRLEGQETPVGSMASYRMALDAAEYLKEEIRAGDFELARPFRQLPVNQSMNSLEIRGASA